ncbi:hypothetical protein EVC45_31610 [Paraburkholderia sp. UYCP14C]|nr:hypothetical protein EVC45_31610 [Paraburkholderia sp. UYCP14C]
MKPPDTPSPTRVRLLAALLLAPLAWLVQMLIAETLAAQSCYPGGEPLPAPVVPWLRPALMAISAVCFIAGASGSLIAWRNLRRVGAKNRSTLSDVPQTKLALAGFLGRVAAMCSALFMFALVATDVALAIVSPCRWW